MLRVKLVKTASIEGFATKLSSYSNYYEEINYGGNQTKIFIKFHDLFCTQAGF